MTDDEKAVEIIREVMPPGTWPALRSAIAQALDEERQHVLDEAISIVQDWFDDLAIRHEAQDSRQVTSLELKLEGLRNPDALRQTPEKP